MPIDDQKCYPFSYIFADELRQQGIKLPSYPAYLFDEERRTDSKAAATDAEGEQERLQALYKVLKDNPRTALCLSGGGIRSATFNLGILQGLAEVGILEDFDYLSTVSGGGYIGSWLSAWRARLMAQGKPAHKGAAPEGESNAHSPLQGEMALITDHLEEPFRKGDEYREIRFLRDYSNYLTPRVGLLTWDTWTLLAIYVRNLLVNWLMLIPLFFAVLILPRLIATLPATPSAAAAHISAGAVLAVLANLFTAFDLPTTALYSTRVRWVQRVRSVARNLFFPCMLLSAFFFVRYWEYGWAQWPRGGATFWSFTGLGAVLFWGGWIIPSLLFIRKNKEIKPREGCTAPPTGNVVFVLNVGALLAGAVGGALCYAVSFIFFPAIADHTWFPKAAYATIAVPAVMVAFLLAGVVFIILTNWYTGDEDREWWGRAGALVLLSILLWVVSYAAVIYGPLLVLHDPADTKSAFDAILKAAGFSGVAGLITALFGKSKRTVASVKGAEQKENPFAKFALQGAALIFIFLLVVLLSSLATLLLQPEDLPAQPPQRHITLTYCPAPDFTPPPLTKVDAKGRWGMSRKERKHLLTFCASDRQNTLFLAFLLAAPIGLSFFFGWLVDPNKFSLHAMYRARLMRAYLGASRDAERKRSPHPFTGFDPDDNMTMAQLADKPFHILNMAWNVVKGKRLAWQERKAVSFTASKYHCGSAVAGYRPSDKFGANKDVGPISLATAMAISGAAASPNMGYHSSPLITFVMSFFNLRLGWWMGNPKYETWRNSGPTFGFGPVLRDTFGHTDEDSDYIYLSDGGHFENLGLYEMVRRRCRYIVVGDASCDPDHSFEDLGNAIRKIRVDLGIEVDLDVTGLKALADEKDCQLRKCICHYAVGTINYSELDEGAVDGKLLYIKPSLCQDIPGDVYAYARKHPDFPHETTADQWFNESQFESYRKLGRHSVAELPGFQKVKKEKLGEADQPQRRMELLFEEARLAWEELHKKLHSHEAE